MALSEATEKRACAHFANYRHYRRTGVEKNLHVWPELLKIIAEISQKSRIFRASWAYLQAKWDLFGCFQAEAPWGAVRGGVLFEKKLTFTSENIFQG